MLKYNFQAIDQLCDDMSHRVSTLTGLKDQLQSQIQSLGAQWEGNTATSMGQAFRTLNGQIEDLGGVIAAVQGAVHTGNGDMSSTDSNLALHWQG